jgi:hypothetical protein
MMGNSSESERLVTFKERVGECLILFTLLMEAISSSELSVLTRATRRHVPEYGIIHNHKTVL